MPTHYTGSLPCPECGSRETSVKDTRPTQTGVRRRRECDNCTHRFSTIELQRADAAVNPEFEPFLRVLNESHIPLAQMGLTLRLFAHVLQAIEEDAKRGHGAVVVVARETLTQ